MTGIYSRHLSDASISPPPARLLFTSVAVAEVPATSWTRAVPHLGTQHRDGGECEGVGLQDACVATMAASPVWRGPLGAPHQYRFVDGEDFRGHSDLSRPRSLLFFVTRRKILIQFFMNLWLVVFLRLVSCRFVSF